MSIVLVMLLVLYVMLKLTLQFETVFKAQTKVRKKVMGVLDIYGFEIFEVSCFLLLLLLFSLFCEMETKSCVL